MGPTGKNPGGKAKTEGLQSNSVAIRKSLKTLQRVASDPTDKENLTGRPVIISIKDNEEIKPKVEAKKKVNSKGIQAGADLKITMEDLTGDAGPSENYWQTVAERRRVALEETLEENRLLNEKIEELESENETLKAMIEESKNLVDVLTEMIGDQESGIDMAEASTVSVVDESQDNLSESVATSTEIQTKEDADDK